LGDQHDAREIAAVAGGIPRHQNGIGDYASSLHSLSLRAKRSNLRLRERRAERNCFVAYSSSQ
jgi:hypothetical protein